MFWRVVFTQWSAGLVRGSLGKNSIHSWHVCELEILIWNTEKMKYCALCFIKHVEPSYMEMCFGHMRTAKDPINLRFCADWSEHSLSTFCIVFTAISQFSLHPVGLSYVLCDHMINHLLTENNETRYTFCVFPAQTCRCVHFFFVPPWQTIKMYIIIAVCTQWS